MRKGQFLPELFYFLTFIRYHSKTKIEIPYNFCYHFIFLFIAFFVKQSINIFFPFIPNCFTPAHTVNGIAYFTIV